MKSHARRPEHDDERETLREKLIAAQNNAIKTNYFKAKIYNAHQNSECRLYSEKDETNVAN